MHLGFLGPKWLVLNGSLTSSSSFPCFNVWLHPYCPWEKGALLHNTGQKLWLTQHGSFSCCCCHSVYGAPSFLFSHIAFILSKCVPTHPPNCDAGWRQVLNSKTSSLKKTPVLSLYCKTGGKSAKRHHFSARAKRFSPSLNVISSLLVINWF